MVSNSVAGLTSEIAFKRLQQDGPNQLPSQKQQSIWSMLWHILTEPMLLLLLGSGVIYFFMGERSDALMLLTAVLVVIAITFFQEKKTERTLEALRDLSSPRALVWRDGEQKMISGLELVRGDVVILREGDRVPADARVFACENLMLDESLLTGESVPVRKAIWHEQLQASRPGGDDLAFVYSGSMVVAGRATVEIIATGIQTEIGKIGRSLSEIKQEETLLHQQTERIVRLLAIFGLIACLLVVLIYVLSKGDLLAGLLAGLTLSMAMLPEEFPVILMIFLTLGAWRISKHQVLTRRSAVIETLGAATVLCTDKTGTLTHNRMHLQSLYVVAERSGQKNEQKGEQNGEHYDFGDSAISLRQLPAKFQSLLEASILASQQDPFDPIEKELYRVGAGYQHQMKLVKEYHLSKDLLALSHVWQQASLDNVVISADSKNLVACKGAPEAVLELCRLGARQRAKIMQAVLDMADQGLRVLAVARATHQSHQPLPVTQADFSFEFVGLLGFIDPLRSGVKEAVHEALQAGMRVIMITGDYAGTAMYVAKQIALPHPTNVLTGDELATMSQSELQVRIKDTNVFARIVPEQKLLIVNALKANGEIVAMTGDGVNDAPALKAAHIGIAMGERGTDVAREAAALVLLNDDFSSIVVATRLGRRIYDNIKRAMGYVLAIHVPIAGMTILPLLFGFPAVLLPAHIAFMELIIDPACSTVFEAETEDETIMKRPPRALTEPLFRRQTIIFSLLQGCGLLLSSLLLFLWAIWTGRGEVVARSFAFASLVLGNLMLITLNLSWRKHIGQILRTASKTFWWTLALALLCLTLVLYLPFFAQLFRLAEINFSDILLITVAVIISLIWFDLFKECTDD